MPDIATTLRQTSRHYLGHSTVMKEAADAIDALREEASVANADLATARADLARVAGVLSEMESVSRACLDEVMTGSETIADLAHTLRRVADALKVWSATAALGARPPEPPYVSTVPPLTQEEKAAMAPFLRRTATPGTGW